MAWAFILCFRCQKQSSTTKEDIFWQTFWSFKIFEQCWSNFLTIICSLKITTVTLTCSGRTRSWKCSNHIVLNKLKLHVRIDFVGCTQHYQHSLVVTLLSYKVCPQFEPGQLPSLMNCQKYICRVSVSSGFGPHFQSRPLEFETPVRPWWPKNNCGPECVHENV